MSRVTEILEDYAFWDGMVKAKRRALDRQRDRKTSKAITYTDAPGGEPESMADYMVRREELEMDLAELKEKRFAAFSEIMKLAFRLPSKKQFDIIYRRHIHLDSWRKICRDLDCGRSTATDLYARAVRSLEDILGED